MYDIKYPVEVYEQTCIGDQAGHLANCEDEEIAKTLAGKNENAS